MKTPQQSEFLDLENKFWTAMKDKDVDAAAALADDPCIVTGAQGVGRLDKATFAKMMAGATWTLHDFEFRDVQFQVLGDSAAVIAYKVREDITVDGKRMTLEASDASTWVKKNGKWVCALHTESVAGDPFGRDRVAK